MNERQDRLFGQVVTAGIDEGIPSAALRDRVLKASLGAVGAEVSPRSLNRKRYVWWLSRGAIAAAVGILVLGGVAFWPKGSTSHRSRIEWWQGPPAAWAQEINAALEKVKAVTCREQTIWVFADGNRSTSSTWDTYYVSEDSYRRDIYDNGKLREIQWYTPDGKGMLQTSVRFDLSSYCVLRYKDSFGRHDPAERVRFHMGLLDRADRALGKQIVDGHECVGFEIRASKYGNNPDTWLDRVWFDVLTKFPVRIEQQGRPVTGRSDMTFTKVKDQFNFQADVPADTFTPKIPAGYINAHPDELQKGRERSP